MSLAQQSIQILILPAAAAGLDKFEKEKINCTDYSQYSYKLHLNSGSKGAKSHQRSLAFLF